MKKLNGLAAVLTAAAMSTELCCPAIVSADYVTSAPQLKETSFSMAMPEFTELVTKGSGQYTPSIPYSPVNVESAALSADELPSAFDLRDTGKVSPVRNQGVYGTCWTHSSAASAETSMIDSIPYIDLSEFHTAYFSYYNMDQIDTGLESVYDILNVGGSAYVVSNLWSQWHGPVSEETMPYLEFDVFDDDEKLYSLSKASDYHMKSAYLFDYDLKKTDLEEVNAVIKNMLYTGHAVDASFQSEVDNYNYTYETSYSLRPARFSNHAVTIVGWDDSMPASYFRNHPEGNGAWLAKNSWGLENGIDGYFWISYYDKSLNDLAVYELSDKDDYRYNYHHDTYIPTQAISASDDGSGPSYISNVFTAEEDISVDAVSLYFNNSATDYEITVYTDLTDENVPSSGTASAVTKGKNELPGYMTIELDESAVVHAGEKYSITAKLFCEGSPYVIPLESCMYVEDESDGSVIDIGNYTTKYQIDTYTGAGESFISVDGVEWEDMKDAEYIFTEEEEQEMIDDFHERLLYGVWDYETELIQQVDDIIGAYQENMSKGTLKVRMGNISMKALANPVGTVHFSHPSGQVAAGEKVELTADGDIFVSINGGDFVPYTGPVEITGPTTIDASLDYVKLDRREYYPAKAQFNGIAYRAYFTDTSYLSGMAERISDSEYVIDVGMNSDELQLFPYTSASITLNGEPVAAAVLSEKMQVNYGETVLTYELTEPGKADNTVTLRIKRDPVGFDLTNERINFSGDITVRTESGELLSDGDTVTPYIGQKLYADDNGTEVAVDVPERAKMPDLEIDYYYEVLGYIPNATAELLRYSITEGHPESSFMPAKDRLRDGTQLNSGMIMNKAVDVIPGETLYLQIAAGNGCFASEVYTYNIPEAPEGPAVLPEYTYEDGRMHFDGNVYEWAEQSISYFGNITDHAEYRGYSDTEKYAGLMKARLGISTDEELEHYIAGYWDTEEAPVFGKEYMIRYQATQESFASKGIIFTEYELGDVNADGLVDGRDASMALAEYADNSSGIAGSLTEDQKRRADTDRDGSVTGKDATLILGVYADRSAENAG